MRAHTSVALSVTVVAHLAAAMKDAPETARVGLSCFQYLLLVAAALATGSRGLDLAAAAVAVAKMAAAVVAVETAVVASLAVLRAPLPAASRHHMGAVESLVLVDDSEENYHGNLLEDVLAQYDYCYAAFHILAEYHLIENTHGC